MQFVQTEITREYTGIPDELMHKVRFVASYSGKDLFDIFIDAYKLSN